MGLQVTPCANLANPERRPEAVIQGCKLGSTICASTAPIRPTNCLSPLVLIQETKSKQPANANYDSQIVPSSSFSPRSHSANFLLSCSSLASLPSLGLSLSGGSSDLYGVTKSQLLADGGSSTSYISTLCTCITTLKNQGNQVACFASSDTRFLYSASSGGAAPCLKTWSRNGGGFYEINTEFGQKKGAVRAFLVVGDQVFSSHNDFTIRVWARPASGKAEKLSCYRGGGGGGDGEHRLVVTLPTKWDCMARAVTPGGYTQVRRHHRKLWIEHTDVISAMAVDARQGYLYSGSWDRSIKVWRLRDFKCMESFRAHDDAINTLAISASGKFLYSGAADGKIKVWMWAKRGHTLVAMLEAHRSAVNALALTADGALLYSGACDKAIVVWEREEMSAQHAYLAGALRGHHQAVLCLASWGDTLCSGSADRSIRVWQRLAGRLHVCLAVLQGHSAPVKSLSLYSRSQQQLPLSASPDCLTCCSAALDYEIRVWQLNLSFSS